jgi:hypothetical protein
MPENRVFSVLEVAGDPQLTARVSTDLVFYTSYGSNMDEDRVKWYFNANSVPGAKHQYQSHYQGAPKIRFPGRIPHRIGFAEVSLIWQNGGKGFIEITPEPDPALHAHTVSYALTSEQFDHIVGEENWQDPRWQIYFGKDYDHLDLSQRPQGPRRAPIPQPVTQLVEHALQGGPLTAPTGYQSSYNRLLLVGFATLPQHRDVPNAPLYPLVTFTRERSLVGADDLNSPSREYIKMMAGGLTSSVPDITTDEAATYFSRGLGTGVDIAGRIRTVGVPPHATPEVRDAGGPFYWTPWTAELITEAITQSVEDARDPRRDIPHVDSLGTGTEATPDSEREQHL